ncbi:hypothetical protein ACFL0L_04850, partial [Patescibacteria group bacterium]
MRAKKIKHTKRIFRRAVVISAIVGFMFLFSSGILAPRPAQALFGVGDVTFTTIVANPAQAIFDAIKKAVVLTANVAFKNTVRAFLNKVAYDSAVYIASGGKGQKPLFITNPGDFITDIGDAAVGDYLDRLSVHVFGTSLCEPIDLQTKVKLDIFARKAIEP